MGKPADPAKVPEGKSDYYVTRPKKPTKTGYVGFETIWKPWHKEVPYKTPERP